MARSGIKLCDSIPKAYNDMKMDKLYKYLIFKITDDKKKVVIDENCSSKRKDKKSKIEPTLTQEEDKAEWDKMMTTLPKNAPRYILYDFAYIKDDGVRFQKLAFMFWSPDDHAPMKEKMIYASTKESIKKAFTGISNVFEAHDLDELDYTKKVRDVEKKK